MNLGNTIQKLRKKKGLKAKELAHRIGVAPTHLSQIENNAKHPRPQTMEAIAEVLEIPVGLLYFLATEESDIPEEKKPAFAVLGDPLSRMIEELFVPRND